MAWSLPLLIFIYMQTYVLKISDMANSIYPYRMDLEGRGWRIIFFIFSLYTASFSTMCNNINALSLGGGNGVGNMFLEFGSLTSSELTMLLWKVKVCPQNCPPAITDYSLQLLRCQNRPFSSLASFSWPPFI